MVRTDDDAGNAGPCARDAVSAVAAVVVTVGLSLLLAAFYGLRIG